MKKTVTLLSIATILGASATTLSTMVSASSSVASPTQHQQVPSALPNPEISKVALVHYNTVRVSFKTPINLSQYQLLMTYTGTDQVDYNLGEEQVLNASGNLIGVDINLDAIAANSTANATIASSLKFKVFDIHTGEMNASSITNSTLSDYITKAVDYGQMEKLGTITDFTKGSHFSLYFEDEVYSENILAGKVTTKSSVLQLEDKQVNNRNISYSVLNQSGNKVGQIRRAGDGDSTLFIFPTNGETFQKDTSYRIMATNYTTQTTEEVFSFTPFYIF